MSSVQRSILGTVIVLVAASFAHSDMLFYASYDSSPDADIAVGSGQAVVRRGDVLLDLTSQERGEFGRALNLYDDREGRTVRYDLVDNIDLEKGTIEFFARLEDLGEKRPHLRYFNFAGSKSFVLAIGPRPNGQGLVLGYSWNGRNGWDYYSEKFVGIGKWQHYAVTWDMSGGKGKGKLSIFVDGIRRIHAENMDPYSSGLESVYVGGRQTS